MSTKQSELYDFSGQIRHETKKALLVFDGLKEIWFPKSHIEDNGDGTFTIPQWLAEKSELV